LTEETLRDRWKVLLLAPIEQRSELFHETPDRLVTRPYSQMNGIGERQPPINSLTNNALPPAIERYGFRAFDRQYIISDGRLCSRPRPQLWQCYADKQLFMISFLTEVLGNGPAAVLSVYIPDRHYFRGSFGGKHIIPLWRDAAATQANVTSGLLEKLGEIYGTVPSAEALFAYCYALLTPRAYVETFAEELLLPGPRIPLTRSSELFGRVAAMGHELIRLHTFGQRDLESDTPPGEVEPGSARCICGISPDPLRYPEDYAYNAESETLRVGDGVFAPVAPAVWEYSVSGLRVVRSWLDYRKKEPNGRSSSPLDAIRPERWTAAMTEELLEVLWTLEKTLELEPVATSLLEEVLSSALIKAEELPMPTAAERAAPGGDDADAVQPSLEL
jgi:hypothetical protein